MKSYFRNKIFQKYEHVVILYTYLSSITCPGVSIPVSSLSEITCPKPDCSHWCSLVCPPGLPTTCGGKGDKTQRGSTPHQAQICGTVVHQCWTASCRVNDPRTSALSLKHTLNTHTQLALAFMSAQALCIPCLC